MATIPLALYMWKRIRQLGIGAVMGLPGDFNMQILDFIYDVPGLHWVGNANELNAAYAADGYARVKGVPGCLVTTHGVGELSAINGIAGATAEHIPVIHIVGQTPRRLQEKHVMIHHSLGVTPDHQTYNKMSKPIRCAAAELWNPKEAPAEIDRVLRECVVQSLPVYIFFPLDLAGEMVPASLVDTPIDFSPPVNSANEAAALQAITEAICSSQNACVFLDHLVHSHGKAEARELIDKLALPFYVSHMGKGIADEDHPCYVGVYAAAALPGVADAFEAADLVLVLGWWPADTNSGAVMLKVPPEKRIDVLDNHVIVKGKKYEGVYLAPLLSKISSTITKPSMPDVPIPKINATPPAADSFSKQITHNYLWPRIGTFLRPGDVLIGETGTSGFGLLDATFPKNIHFISQSYFMSIGYATPCALGVELALRELQTAEPKQTNGYTAHGSPQRRRTILVTGDGSLLLTIQEVGTMIMRGVRPIIIIINNAGYTIEKAIHGARAQYNDIAQYDYSKMLALFGAKEPERCYRCVRTPGELEAALEEEALREPQEVQVLEVRMQPLDIPWRLAKLLKAGRGPNFAKYLIEEGFTNSSE